MGLRVAICGSGGVGKTTLAVPLARQLRATYIPEHFESFFDRPGKFRSPPPILAELFNEVLERKRAEEQAQESYVVDRSPIDLFNLWLAQGLALRAEDTKRFHANCRDYCAAYDFVVILPWGALPLVPSDHVTGRQRRVLNPWVQLSAHASIAGLARMWIEPQRIVELPASITDAQERLGFVMGRIRPS